MNNLYKWDSEEGQRTCVNLCPFVTITKTNIQSTLDISKSKRLPEILWDIRTSTYQICRIVEKIYRITTFNNWICNLTPKARDILKIFWKRGEIAPYNTVDSRYLEFQGTSEILRDIRISTYQICRTEEKIIRTITFNKYILIGLLKKLEMYWKYCGKEEKLLLRSNFSSFPQSFLPVVSIFMFKQGQDFHFEMSGYSR